MLLGPLHREHPQRPHAGRLRPSGREVLPGGRGTDRRGAAPGTKTPSAGRSWQSTCPSREKVGNPPSNWRHRIGRLSAKRRTRMPGGAEGEGRSREAPAWKAPAGRLPPIPIAQERCLKTANGPSVEQGRGVRRYRGVHAAEYGGIPLRSGVAVRSARPGSYEQAVDNCPTGRNRWTFKLVFAVPREGLPQKWLILFLLELPAVLIFPSESERPWDSAKPNSSEPSVPPALTA